MRALRQIDRIMGAAPDLLLCLAVSRQRRDGTFVALIGPDAFSCNRLFERFADSDEALNYDAANFVLNLAGNLFPAAIGATPAQALVALNDRLRAVGESQVTAWASALEEAYSAIVTCVLSPYRKLADCAGDGRIPRVE